MSEQKEASGLKELLASLRESNGILEGSEHKLDYLATNSPQDGEDEDKAPVSDAATLDDLHRTASSIHRRANHIAKSANIIVGS